MESKVAAAELAAGAGIPTVIADGDGDGVLTAALAGRAPGTRFAAAERRAGVQALAAARQAGRRADRASTRARDARSSSGGASLLAVGVTGWDGDFRAGDGVELVGPDGVVFARGIASVDAAELAGQAGERRGRAPRPARRSSGNRTTHFPK